MSFLSRILRESVSVHRNLGRVGRNLLQGDLSGAAAAGREAGRTVIHGVKRDLLGNDGNQGSGTSSQVSGGEGGTVAFPGGTPGFYDRPSGGGSFVYRGGTPGFYEQQRVTSQQMLQSFVQLNEQWKRCSQA